MTSVEDTKTVGEGGVATAEGEGRVKDVSERGIGGTMAERLEEKTNVGGPSNGAKPKKFREKQQKDPTVYNGRPFERTGPPIALYNEIFGRFIQESNDENLVMTADHYKWTVRI
ncbi:7385_t:CDS:2, partial [Paraglomus occultum]